MGKNAQHKWAVCRRLHVTLTCSQARSHVLRSSPRIFERPCCQSREIWFLHSLVFVKWFPVDDECCAPFSVLASECNVPDTSVEATSYRTQERNVFCKMETVRLAFSEIFVLSPWAPVKRRKACFIRHRPSQVFSPLNVLVNVSSPMSHHAHRRLQLAKKCLCTNLVHQGLRSRTF